MWRRRNFIVLFIIWLAAGCGDAGRDTLAPEDLHGVQELPNADLALLYRHYYGKPFLISEDMIFEGFVTANDASGNFFKSFIIDDGTAAVEIRAGFYDLYALYPVGRRVLLHAKGLAVGMYNGVIQIGPRISDDNSASVDEFGFQWMLDRFLERDNRFGNTEPLPFDKTLGAGSCGRVVRSGRVRRIDEFPEVWAGTGAADYAGTNVSSFFRDSHGDTLCVVTSRYASFADSRIPTDSISISGILLYGNFGYGNRFAIKLRDTDDIQF